MRGKLFFALMSTVLTAVTLSAQPPKHADSWKQRFTLTIRDPGGVNFVAFSPDGELLATCTYEGSIRLWNTQTGKQQLALALRTKLLKALSFSVDGKEVTTVTENAAVTTWDAGTGKAVKTWRAGTVKLSAAALSPDGKTLVTAPDNGRGFQPGKGVMQFWDMEKAKVTRTVEPHQLAPGRLFFSADGKKLLSVGSRPLTPADGPGLGISGERIFEAKAWDVAGGEGVMVNPKTGTHDACSADGGTLMTCRQDERTFQHYAEVWDVATRKKKTTTAGFREILYSATISPDGKLLATGGTGYVVRLWDAESGKQFATLSRHAGEIMALGFSADSNQLAAADSRGGIVLWAREGSK
jgi:WD40 repeat protein